MLCAHADRRPPHLVRMRPQVRVLYNGRPIALAGGEPGRDTCTLAEFRALVAPYCVRDFASEGASGGGAALASTTAGFNAEQK